MTMLDIAKSRLPGGVELVRVKEMPGRYDLTLDVNGVQKTCYLSKTCAPGMAETAVDFSIYTTMMVACLESGDYKGAKFWRDKQDNLVRLK